MKKLQKNNRKLKIFSKVIWKVEKRQKVWKVLKSWKKCGKVEKNANNFGKKLKKMKKNCKTWKVYRNRKKVEKSATKSSKSWKIILDLSYLREEVIMRVSKSQCPHLLES